MYFKCFLAEVCSRSRGSQAVPLTPADFRLSPTVPVYHLEADHLFPDPARHLANRPRKSSKSGWLGGPGGTEGPRRRLDSTGHRAPPVLCQLCNYPSMGESAKRWGDGGE